MGDTGGPQTSGMSEYQESANMCFAGDVKTPFALAEDIDSMRFPH